MTTPCDDIEREALDWLVRVNDPAFDDWTAWEAWLARDPRHAEAYWTLAEREADIVADLAAATASGSADAPLRPKLRLWRAAVGIAAGVAIAVAVALWSWPDDPVTHATDHGEQKTVTLADGSRLHLDGATRVTIRGARSASLEQGRILAQVVHDDARPFTLAVGQVTVTDLGTAFDVTRLQDGARVTVTEGLVEVDVDDRAYRLSPGEGLVAQGHRVERRAQAADEVEAWRAGRLAYHGELLTVVAQDLARVLGRPVTVDSTLRDRRFTGSIGTGGDPTRLRERLELLLGVSIRDDGAGWRLAAAPAP